ncbi:MAG: hypothetical protein R3E39_12295 [Anaerolineae bacterium]
MNRMVYHLALSSPLSASIIRRLEKLLADLYPAHGAQALALGIRRWLRLASVS